jgi:hypothetical protein
MREFKKIQNAKFKVALARAFLGYARVVKLIVGPASMSRKVRVCNRVPLLSHHAVTFIRRSDFSIKSGSFSIIPFPNSLP